MNGNLILNLICRHIEYLENDVTKQLINDVKKKYGTKKSKIKGNIKVIYLVFNSKKF